MKNLACQFVSLVVLLAGVVSRLAAQSPAGPELLLNEGLVTFAAPGAVACDQTASCSVVWFRSIPDDPESRNWIHGRSIGQHGELRPLKELRFKDLGFDVDLQADGTGYLLSWTGRDSANIFPNRFQELDSYLEPRSEPVVWEERPSDLALAGFRSALPSDAGYVVLWASTRCPDSFELDLNLTLLSRSGLQLVTRTPVDGPPGETLDRGGSFATDSSSRLLVAYRRGIFGGLGVFLRRFDPWLNPLDSPLRIDQSFEHRQSNPEIAVAPSGESVVAWQTRDLNVFSGQRIVARRLGADGLPLGDEVIVSDVTRKAQYPPKVAMDEHGNFVVMWLEFIPDIPAPFVQSINLTAQLFRADGTPVSDEIIVNRPQEDIQLFADIAFASNGTFVASWSRGFAPGGDFEQELFARRFSASMGEEICWWSKGALRCDLGRTGGKPELRTWAGWVAGEAGGVALLGDYDGDGREDLCSWRAGELACDLDHEGRPPEGRQRFGRAGDTPLLGDVDGDGEADLCVRRKRRLLCDTARDGGYAEMQRALRTRSGVPLLGDVDGDGRDEVCLFRKGVWRCLLWGGGRLITRFGATDGQPALGDMDGDGRADLCVFSAGTLRCDTAHDGGAGEFSLAISAPSATRLLLGNLDGL